jgi:hypothetical protein
MKAKCEKIKMPVFAKQLIFAFLVSSAIVCVFYGIIHVVSLANNRKEKSQETPIVESINDIIDQEITIVKKAIEETPKTETIFIGHIAEGTFKYDEEAQTITYRVDGMSLIYIYTRVMKVGDIKDKGTRISHFTINYLGEKNSILDKRRFYELDERNN